VHKTSSPGFLAAGFKLPIARLGKPAILRRESGLFDFIDHETSLNMQEAAIVTINNAIKKKNLFFILPASFQINLIIKSSFETLVRFRRENYLIAKSV
jgi:hypothetical protein